MIWKKIIEILTYPVVGFWNYYKQLKKDKQWGRLIFIFICSVLALLFGICAMTYIAYQIVYGVINLIALYPSIILIVSGLAWIYMAVKNKSDAEETQANNEQKERTQNEIKEQADQGYPTMLNVMYQTLRNEADGLGGCMPTYSAEVEMDDAHFITKSNVILYQFKLEKKDIKSLCDTAMLKEYCNNLQYRLRTKLNNGEFPSVKLTSFRDKYGTGMDGIVVDHMEDFGRYYVIYTAFASPEYAEYRRSIMAYQMARADNTDIQEEWEQ